MTVGPVSGSGAPSQIDLEVLAAGLTAGPETALAAATAQLEEAADRSRSARRESRVSRRASQLAEIREMRRGAKFALGSGLVTAGGQVASGILGDSGGATVKALGGAATSVLDFYESDAQQEAKRHAMDAQTHSDQVSDEGEAVSRAERFADKALGHQEAIARARHEATMAAIRG